MRGEAGIPRTFQTVGSKSTEGCWFWSGLPPWERWVLFTKLQVLKAFYKQDHYLQVNKTVF